MRTSFLIVFMLFLGSSAYGGGGTADWDRPFTFEQEKFYFEHELEKEKFTFQKDLEEKKLAADAGRIWKELAGVILPIVLAITTLAWQIRAARKLKEHEIKHNFELKALEIALGANNPHGVKLRIEVIKSLFPDTLPKNFGESYDTSKYGGKNYGAKLEVFKAASSKANSAEEVIMIWYKLWPKDEWLSPLLDPSAAQTD